VLSRWYRTGVIYSLDVSLFHDANGDGIGDLQGLSLGDFASLLHEAGERGIRVMLDLVVNHTSEAHPWFQAARWIRLGRRIGA